MTAILSKMQLRSVLLAILNKYRTIKIPNSSIINSDIDEILSFQDQEFVAKLLFKELQTDNIEYSNVCAIFALEIVDNKLFEKYAIEILANPDISDNKKFFIISLIKQKGIQFNYDDISSYVTSPQNVAHDSVMDFLTNVLFDPEAKIDLVDFYINVSHSEKICLLENLIQEPQNDSVACTFSLLLQLDLSQEEFEILYNALINSNSPYAIDGLNYIIQNYKINSKTAWKIKSHIKQIEDENPDFIKNSIIRESTIFETFIGLIDGNSNFSIGIARKLNDESIYAMFTTININYGIVATLGFGNINYENYITIKSRLFDDSPYYSIPKTIAKTLFDYYLEKNKKTNSIIPYEYKIWSEVLYDIKPINYNIKDYLNNKLESINLSDNNFKKIINSKLTESWYFIPNQNEYFDDLINIIEKEHLIELDEIDIIIENKIKELLLNKQFIEELNNKLLLSAYIARLARLKLSSSILYSLSFKNPYIKIFISTILYRSLYQYFGTSLIMKQKTNKNRFKNIKTSNFNIEELDLLLAQIEEKWN